MADSVTIGASVAVRNVRDVDQGIYEYLEEHHPRFCVFKAEQTALFVFSDDDTVNGKLLRRLVLTKVTLTSRTDRSFVAQGYVQDRELHKKASDSMVRRASSLRRGLLPGDKQRFFMPEEERFKAVSTKACSVWTHCFKYHMKSYVLRQKETEAAKEDVEMDPDFVFEDTTKNKRRYSMPGSSFRSSSSGFFSASRARSRSRSKSRGKVVVRRRASVERDSEGLKSPPKFTAEGDLASRVATENSQSHDAEFVEVENPVLMSDLPIVSSVWEDEELLSHRIDFDTIVKEEKLAAGACGEVWRAMHRSQEVVVKNLRQEVVAGAKSPSSSSTGEVTAVYHRRRAILDFVEEVRIMSRLEHNRIVEFRGVALSAERDLLLVMEYLPRGDLRTFLCSVKRKCDSSLGMSGGPTTSRDQFQSIWTWTKSQWRIAIDIIEGLVYLHSLNPPLIHGDLKSANVLLRSNLRAKLTDFGLSRYLLTEDDVADTIEAGGDENVKPNSNSSRYGSRARGTGRWMAPELLTCGAQSSMASDVYAFGIVLSEIDTCEMPFYEREKLATRSLASGASSAGEGSSEDGDSRMMTENAIVHKIVTEGWKPTFRVTCPETIKKLAHDCISPDPKLRPTSLAVAHRLRKAAVKRERPEILAAQAKVTTSLRIR
ncbi:TKL protein kinase [Phytophthora megakarya]|uniref:TKL protein kinase n=1 Tax=Phytophthora megakarya TaxID=4795 RepID=A0A225VKR0_9STRA|nr:TKL protein kinase [Phytophthora megakarya]